MPSGGQDRKADAAGVTSSLPPETVYDTEKAALIDASPAIQLLQALRHPGERIWLQTFADAPDSAYVLEEKISHGGHPYTVKRWCLTNVPKPSGKVGKVQGVAENWGAVTLDQLADTPYSRANLARVGVFFAVNVLQADAPRRKAEHVARVAAVFLDLDGAPLPADFPLQPTATVESSTGRHHVYWAVDGVPLEEFKTIQQTLAGLYGADTQVCDLPRVMRLPGYYHGKRDPGELVRLTSIEPDAQYTRADLLEAWPPLAEALATAAAEQEQQHHEAEERRAAAAQLRQALSTGTAGTKAETQRKYGEVVLLGCCADVLAAPIGQRNTILNAAAYRVARLIGASFIEESTARAELEAVAARIGLEKSETVTTLNSAFEAGKASPVDPDSVGQFVGVKRRKEKKSSPALTRTAEAVADEQARETQLPSADEIPDPEGEGGSYSDQQVKTLLQLDFPTVAADTDTAHAYRLKAVAGDDLAYIPELGGYAAFNGKQWLSGGKDGPGQVEAKRHAQRLGLAMKPEVERLLALYGVLAVAAAAAEARSGRDSEEAKEARHKAEAMEKAYFHHSRAAKATEGDAKQKAILSSARTLYVKPISDFEPRPWLVGFQNGVWDRGEFRPARREDHMLNLAAVDYLPDVDRRDWAEVLSRITGGDTDLQRTLQDVAGYALSGASSLRLLPWLYGEGGTGKGTYSEMLGTVLGEMAETISPKHLATDADRERLGAVIWGKRVALCAEAGNARLDAESLKTLSGGDRLAVRKLYAESFTARPSHVLVMVANDPPRVEAYDDALKDRVLALPFTHPLKVGGPLLGGRRLEEARQDTSSALVLGFAAWAVEGLERVYRAGDVHRAEVCKAATRAFWADVDPLHDFWLGLDRTELLSFISVAALRRTYESWCESVGSRPLGTQKFNKACRSVGLDAHSNGRERGWKLFKPAAFPDAADQAGAGHTDNFDNFDPNSLKPKNFSIYAREEKDFRKNGPEVVKVVSNQAAGWEGDDL